MSNAYSHVKALRHLDVIQAVKAGVPSRLPHVELIISDACPHRCHFCSYRLDGYTSNQRFDKHRMIATDKIYEILDDCAEIGVQAIQFTGGGEPTLHPDFDCIISRTAELGMKFSVVSNGARIDWRLAEKVSKAAWVRISLDAATEETYVKIRRIKGDQWQKAKDSVKLIREYRDKNKTDCVIGVGFVVTPDNWKEVGRAAILARLLGADNFRISAQFSSEDEHLFAGFSREASELCKEAEIHSGKDFTVYNRFDDRLNDLTFKNPEDKICGYQFFTTYIGADLQVYRCCGYAYNDRGHLGSLANKRFKDFWLSQERFNKQWDFDGRGCERCQFRKINSVLAPILDTDPQLHEEFV